VIAQIKLLQSACNSYCMSPDPKFIQWFQRQQLLTEEERWADPSSFGWSCSVGQRNTASGHSLGHLFNSSLASSN